MMLNKSTALRPAVSGARGSVRVVGLSSNHASGAQASPAGATRVAPACTRRVSLHHAGSHRNVLPPAQVLKGISSFAKKQPSTTKPAPGNYNCKIFTQEGATTKLELLLSFVAEDQHPVGTAVDLSTFEQTPWMGPDASGNTIKLGVIYQGQVDVPQEAVNDLVILRVKPTAKVDKEYVNKVEVTTDQDGDGPAISIVPNSWIHKAQGGRVFFGTGLALLPGQTPAKLASWRAAELDGIKGSQVQQMDTRNDWDRIYDYDVYNDLAGYDKSGRLLNRPTLGGSKFPYPRRIRTGRPRIRGPDGELSYESRSTDPFWVPLDERFNTVKESNFKVYKLMAALPTLADLVRSKLFFKGRKVETFKDVDELYAEMRQSSFTVTAEQLVSAMQTSAGRVKDTAFKLLGIDPEEVLNLPLLGQVQAGAAKSAFKNIEQMVGGVSNLTDFPRPLVAGKGREGLWQRDEEWGRQALAGVNPSSVEALTSANAKEKLGAITEAHLQPHLQGHSLADLLVAAGTQPRLLVIDHRAVFADYAAKISAIPGRYGYSGLAVLYQRDDDLWVPIAIELTGSEEQTTVYTPADHANVWLVAKGVFNSLDSGYHQLITHWLRCHAATEPYIISTHRNLSTLHPVYKLMVPHWRFTPQINSNARQSLIAAGGIIEGAFTPGPYAFEMCSKVYEALWFFDKQGLPADLIDRGLAKKGADGKVQLLLKDYPYADDGMLIWNAVHDWVGKYLRCYYDDAVPEKSITEDVEIQNWWNEIQVKGHPDKKEGWPELKCIDDLTEILTTMIWVTSAHHAAINFSQYAYTGYYLNRPTICTKPIPQKDSPPYQELLKNGEKAYIQTLSDDKTLLAVVTVELLSTHADNEAYLSDPNHPYILDEVPRKLYQEFAQKIKEIEGTIHARNQDKTYKLRTGTDCALPYESLAPTSGPGITNRGIPQSVSI